MSTAYDALRKGSGSGSLSLEDLVRLIDPNETGDEAVLRSNLSFYSRKYAHDPEYVSFFEHVYRTFVKNGLLRDAASEGSGAGGDDDDAAQPGPKEKHDGDGVFDVSRYTIGELAAALDYDLAGHGGAPPDIQALRRDRRAYERRLEALDDDDDEERRHKAKARAFFDAAYDMLTSYLYPNYGGLRSAARRLASEEPPSSKPDAPYPALPAESMAPPGMLAPKGDVERPRAVSSQMAASSSQMAAASSSQAAPVAASSYGAANAPAAERRTRTTTINVDTRFRGNYFDKSRGEVTSSSEIHFSLDERVKNVRQMSIASLEYPNSAYAISSALKSNVFYIQVCKNGYQTSNNAGLLVSGLPANGAVQYYYDHKRVHKQTTGGHVGTYRVSMMSGNYNKDTLVASINYALRTNDVSSGLAAVTVEFNTAFNKMILRTVDPSSGDATEAASIYYPGVSLPYESRTYMGRNATGGLVTTSKMDFSFNLFFEMYEELDASGNYDLSKPLKGRPLFFNAGWVMGFRKERYAHDDGDYVVTLERQTDTDVVSSSDDNTGYFLGYNAEAPYDVNSMRYFYVCVTDYVTSGNSSYIQGVRNDANYVQTMYGMPTDVIARVVNNGPKLHYTFFDRSDFINKTRVYDVPVTLQNFKIRMTDEYGRELDLQRMDWSAAIELVSEVD